jgi:hypothetical protein
MKPILKLTVSILLGASAVLTAQKSIAQVSGTISIPGDYPTITAALNQINTVGLSGPAILELQPGYSSLNESFPIVFTNINGASNTNTLTLRPSTGAAGLIIASPFNSATIDLVNASNVIIDGRPGGVGSSRALTIRNQTPNNWSIHFAQGSSHNLIKHCVIQGVNIAPIDQFESNTIIYFDGFAGAGNRFNEISNCVIKDDGSGPLYNAILSQGNSASPNSDNSILNNEIANFSGTGISISAYGNGGNWAINGNSFYNDLPTPPSTAQTAIYFNPGTGSDNNSITGNFIGGQGVNASGAKWTNTGDVPFTGIYLSSGTLSGTSLHNNVIQNISLSSVGSNISFTGISIASGISTNNGNIVGSATEANSIVVSGSSSTMTGILVNSSSPVSVTGDNIGNITVSGDGANIMGIRYAGGAAVTITGNSIHDFSANNTDDVDFTGIYIAGGGITSSLLHDNTVQKITLTSTSAIQFTGVSIASGVTNNNGNTVGSATEANSIMLSGSSVSARGILVSSSSAVSVSGDNIGNITTSGGETNIMGIQYTGGTAVTITGNSIHDFSTNNNDDISFTGVYIGGGGITPSLLHDNTVQKITLTSTQGVQFNGVTFASGVTGNNGNIIGSATEANSIVVSGSSGTITGILISSSSPVSVSNDIIGNITATGNNATVNGIFVNVSAGSPTVTLDNNVITGNNAGTGVKAFVSGAGVLIITATGNKVNNWAKGFLLSKNAGAVLQPSIHDNVIAGNQFGFDNQSGIQQNATCNWWGSASGPSGAGPGTGDAVSPTVLFSPWATIATFVSVNAGPDQTIYIGYGSQSKTLTASAVACGGAGYLWSTGATSSSIIVNPVVTTTYTITITDAAGHSATDNVTVFVQDVRCEKNKILVCHNGQTLCVNIGAVPDHLKHGDVLGTCLSNTIVSGMKIGQEDDDIFLLKNFPNPFHVRTTIQYSITERSHVRLKIFDQLGREVIDLVNTVREAGKYNLEYNAANIPGGIYSCILITERVNGSNSQRITRKIVLLR